MAVATTKKPFRNKHKNYVSVKSIEDLKNLQQLCSHFLDSLCTHFEHHCDNKCSSCMFDISYTEQFLNALNDSEILNIDMSKTEEFQSDITIKTKDHFIYAQIKEPDKNLVNPDWPRFPSGRSLHQVIKDIDSRKKDDNGYGIPSNNNSTEEKEKC